MSHHFPPVPRWRHHQHPLDHLFILTCTVYNSNMMSQGWKEVGNPVETQWRKPHLAATVETAAARVAATAGAGATSCSTDAYPRQHVLATSAEIEVYVATILRRRQENSSSSSSGSSSTHVEAPKWPSNDSGSSSGSGSGSGSGGGARANINGSEIRRGNARSKSDGTAAAVAGGGGGGAASSTAADEVHKQEPMECMFVEVKSPNDRLSEKQLVWLHVLQSFGVQAAVCNVVHCGGDEEVADFP